MKSSHFGLHRGRVILYYTLAVVLPGLFLGYLAYRGIRNDQALREKESRRKLEIKSQAFFEAIDSGIVRFINEPVRNTVLHGKKRDDPLLLAFSIDDSGITKRILTHRLLYLPDEILGEQSAKQEQKTSLNEGLRLEFEDHNLPEAISFYQKLMNRTFDPTEKIQFLFITARLFNKMNRPDSSKTIYEKIRYDCPDCLLNGKIPVSLAATFEILKINRQLGEKEEMKNNSRVLVDFLLHPSCSYSEDQFEWFYQSAQEMIRENELLPDSLFKILDSRKVKTESVKHLMSRFDFSAGISKVDSVRLRKGVLFTPVIQDGLTALVLSLPLPDRGKTFFIIDFPAFFKYELESLLRHLDPEEMMNIRIEDNAGKEIFTKKISEEADYIAFPFPENLPGWKLLMSEERPGFMVFLVKAGSGVYLYVFILIVLLMVLGFTFTIYTLNSELRLNRLKSEFISNVSHELKSPLTSIRMMTEMLHQKRVTSEEQKSDYYSAMLAESERLSHLIDNILDFSRMEEDRKVYTFTEINPDELIRWFLDSIREKITDSGFEVRFIISGTIPFIMADRDGLLQILYNLVDNAIKFSGTSRRIDIEVSAGEDEVQLKVRDYGIGILMTDQEKIFDRFYRSGEANRLRIAGSGIGLTIVKKIIEAHNWKIAMTSDVGKGSCFTISIPVKGF